MVDAVYGVVGRDPANDGLVEACTDAIVPILINREKKTIKYRSFSCYLAVFLCYEAYGLMRQAQPFILTRNCAKSSNFDKLFNSIYIEYTVSQPHTLSIAKIAHEKQMNKLYTKIKSLTMQKNNQANDRNTVNIPNDHSHGWIFSSYSWEWGKMRVMKGIIHR